MAANYKEITNLIKLVSKSELTEFKMKDGDLEITIRTDKYVKLKDGGVQPIVQMAPQQMPSPSASAPSTPQASQAPSAPAKAPESSASDDSEVESTEGLLEIKSPIVGTFYRSSAPDKPPYVKVGDSINTGDVVCIVEAMKLFNEIESEISGKVVKVLVEDASPVEYDQVLFLVDPKG